jgi:hypothetical protein
MSESPSLLLLPPSWLSPLLAPVPDAAALDSVVEADSSLAVEEALLAVVLDATEEEGLGMTLPLSSRKMPLPRRQQFGIVLTQQ